MEATLKIYVGTWARYNTGNSSGKWLSLPMSEKQLESELNKIAGGERDPEYAILDSECTADFRAVSESDNIFHLNKEAASVKKETKAKKAVSPAMQEVFDFYSSVYADGATMAEYCQKRVGNAYKLESGHLVEFEKPSIETRFCFGYGSNGISNEEDYQNARESAETSKKKSAFICANMKESFGCYDAVLFQKETEREIPEYYAEPYLRYGQENALFCYLRRRKWDQWGREIKGIFELTNSDIVGLRAVLECEKQKFLKRLNAWWKRYGSEGLHAWTYLQD